MAYRISKSCILLSHPTTSVVCTHSSEATGPYIPIGDRPCSDLPRTSSDQSTIQTFILLLVIITNTRQSDNSEYVKPNPHKNVNNIRFKAKHNLANHCVKVPERLSCFTFVKEFIKNWAQTS